MTTFREVTDAIVAYGCAMYRMGENRGVHSPDVELTRAHLLELVNTLLKERDERDSLDEYRDLALID